MLYTVKSVEEYSWYSHRSDLFICLLPAFCQMDAMGLFLLHSSRAATLLFPSLSILSYLWLFFPHKDTVFLCRA